MIPMAIAKTILVVDDDNALRLVIVAALKKAGYTTVEATDGLQGIAQAKRTKPHLIISDVYMDNMNGFMMVETLKEDEETSSIPVIMMTSAAQAAGAWDTSLADDYIDKGFSMTQLMERVKKILK
jgi:CheY-like chemotaxis protein